MAETGQRLPEPHAPKVLLRFSLYLLYFLYVGVPLLLSGIAVYAASRHRWGEALMFAVFSAGEAVLGEAPAWPVDLGRDRGGAGVAAPSEGVAVKAAVSMRPT